MKAGRIDSLQFNISDSMLIDKPGYLIKSSSAGIDIIDMKINKLKELTFGMKINKKIENGGSWLWLDWNCEQYRLIYFYFFSEID